MSSEQQNDAIAQAEYSDQQENDAKRQSVGSQGNRKSKQVHEQGEHENGHEHEQETIASEQIQSVGQPENGEKVEGEHHQEGHQEGSQNHIHVDKSDQALESEEKKNQTVEVKVEEKHNEEIKIEHQVEKSHENHEHHEQPKQNHEPVNHHEEKQDHEVKEQEQHKDHDGRVPLQQEKAEGSEVVPLTGHLETSDYTKKVPKLEEHQDLQKVEEKKPEEPHNEISEIKEHSITQSDKQQSLKGNAYHHGSHLQEKQQKREELREPNPPTIEQQASEIKLTRETKPLYMEENSNEVGESVISRRVLAASVRQKPEKEQEAGKDSKVCTCTLM